MGSKGVVKRKRKTHSQPISGQVEVEKGISLSDVSALRNMAGKLQVLLRNLAANHCSRPLFCDLFQNTLETSLPDRNSK